MWVLTHHSAHFSGDCIFALKGGLCPEIFTRARDWPRLPSAHPSWDGSPPPKKINRENLKFGLKFSVYTSISSQLMGISSKIFIHTTCREPGVITCVQFLEGLLLKFGRAKKRPIFFAISDNFRLWSRISPEQIHKSKIEKVFDQLRPLRRWAKSFLTLVHKLKSYWRSAHFSGDCIFALKVGCALKFLHALEIDHGYLADTPIGTGSPPPKKN